MWQKVGNRWGVERRVAATWELVRHRQWLTYLPSISPSVFPHTYILLLSKYISSVISSASAAISQSPIGLWVIKSEWGMCVWVCTYIWRRTVGEVVPVTHPGLSWLYLTHQPHPPTTHLCSHSSCYLMLNVSLLLLAMNWVSLWRVVPEYHE